jgi:hypothetical protein
MSDLVRFRAAAWRWAIGRDRDAEAEASALSGSVARVVLVEGVSDAAALDAAALAAGRELESERVCVLPMRGVTNVGRFLGTLGPAGLGLSMAGLCDAGEERYFLRALLSLGMLGTATREAMAAAGFFVCVDDLEDELIRGLGAERILRILDACGDLPRFRTFQSQPAKRGERVEVQLHRFLGTTAGRKERYARLLVEGFGDSRPPQPLSALLDFVG